ncbi:hypothetical protein ABBQ32_006505 [Trebouxia sp. C0010 RCD-2024]
MGQLRRDVEAVKQRIKSSSISTRFDGWDVDGGSVTVKLKPDKQFLTCTIFYMSDSDYPNSPLMAMCADDDATNSALESFGDYFEYGAPVLEVLIRLLEAVGLDAAPLVAQQGSDAACGGDKDLISEEDYSDTGQDMAETDNQELLEAVLRKVSTWDKAESALQAAEDEATAADSTPSSAQVLSMEEQLAKKRQIFAPLEAYKMLARELKDMMLQPSNGVAVDAVGTSVWQWDMWFTDFDASSHLAQGLHAVHQQHDCNHVHLRLSFKRGLHPFYPPLLDLLHPRFKGPVNGALASHPVAQLQHWDPWRTLQDLAAKLKSFLQAVAEVDVAATVNSLQQHQAAYLPVEQQLARLEGLCAQSVLPLCYADHKDLYQARDAGVDALRMEALAPSPKRSKTGEAADQADKSTAKAAWAAGTGYGSDYSNSAPIWDAKHAEASQAAQDAELEKLLNELAAGLRQQLADTTEDLASSSAAEGSDGVEGRQQQPEASTSTSTSSTGNDRDAFRDAVSIQRCIEALHSSCLLPFLDTQLGSASFNDMASRASYYTTLFRVIWELSTPRTAHILTTPMQPSSEQGAQRTRSIQDLMAALKQSAQRFRQVMGPACHRWPPPTTVPAAEAEEEQACLDLADLILETAKRVDQLTSAAGPSSRAQPMDTQPDTDASQAYITQMRTLDQVDMATNVAGSHCYKDKAGVEGAVPRARQARVGKELAGMAADLPLNASSSVFLRVDEKHMMLWKALITGPEDTPYSGGCFEFDIYFPPTYPQVPMNVKLKTTGGSSVRFNPNLYNCGKVCLSLLGTWSGARGETWDPRSSSTLQMLISIQSLIFVDEPYFNEPGYEGTMHTPQGDTASRAYNRNIRENTLHWAIFQALKSPPPPFKEIVKKHFQLRKDSIVTTCHQWIEDAKSDGATQVASRMQDYLASWLRLLG